jgi:hypothetical protein
MSRREVAARGVQINMRPLRAGVVLSLAVGAIACSKAVDYPYPPDVVQSFLHSCEERATAAACKCAIDQVQRSIPLEQFRDMEAAISRGERPSQALTDAAAKCR